MRQFLALVLSVLLLTTACAAPSEAPGPMAADLPSTRIGAQTWTTRNLAVRHYRNGDSIRHAETAEQLIEFGREGVGAWMYVGGDPATESEYGLLYNWFAVTDPRGLAPEGWHVPSDAEWQRLADHLGPDSAGVRMKVPDGWKDGGGGTNASGFDARPAGFRHWGGEYDGLGVYGSWWTTTDLADDDYYAWFRGVGFDYDHMHRDRSSKQLGMSVRLVRDAVVDDGRGRTGEP